MYNAYIYICCVSNNMISGLSGHEDLTQYMAIFLWESL